ncbi:MAG: Xaa-Pro peptidase family protein [Verrucomicrobia bacterium]|nr:Xaa-Pro peptidase family protein [Verrucomicrobiota bacterium]
MSDTLLIVADSERDANMLYATGMFVPDAFIYFRHRGKSTVVMSDLEIDRAKHEARADEVISMTEIAKPLEKRLGRRAKFADVVATIFRRRHIRTARVPANFSLVHAEQLRQHGIRVWTDDTPVFPQRELKRPNEVKAIERALRTTEAGLAAGIATIRAARVAKDGRLTLGGSTLTSERVRAEIDIAMIRLGGIGAHTIVAGGNQACDPHDRGSGPLRANQAIILDVFPRDERTGYYGDMTRTVVRGKASEALRCQFEAVREAQRAAIRTIHAGIDGHTVHRAVQKVFAERGYKTGIVEREALGVKREAASKQPRPTSAGRQQGFFHGTGHGLGLQVHEAPRMGVVPCRLRAGHVVTVEPGLYYPGVGGIRIEDVVLVTTNGCRLLSKFPVALEI